MALQLQLHPNVAPLFGQAQVAARGPNPQLMCDQGHTLCSYNANWITTQQNFGPGGEVGIDEGDIASFLANAVRPGDNAVDAAGVAPGVFTHGLANVYWDRCWRRLVADGFDASAPAAQGTIRSRCGSGTSRSAPLRLMIIPGASFHSPGRCTGTFA